MDYGKILKRAWSILWNYKALWVFGILVAMTAAGGGGGSNTGFRFNGGGNTSNNSGNSSQFFFNQDFFEEFQDFADSQTWNRLQEPSSGTIIAIIIGVALVILALVVISAFLQYISQTAMVRMVDTYEETGEKRRVGAGFRLGWSRGAWRIFLQNLLISIPNILFVIMVIVVFGLGILAITQEWTVVGIILTVAGAILFFLGMLLLIVVNIILGTIKQFAWRATILETLGVFAGFRRGIAIIRHNFKDVALMWLILFGITIGWVITLIPVSILLLPVFFILFVLGLVVGAVPGMAVVGIVSLFAAGEWAWIAGAIVALPFAFLIGSAPWLFLGGLFQTYTSSAWTLTFRELLLKTSSEQVE